MKNNRLSCYMVALMAFAFTAIIGCTGKKTSSSSDNLVKIDTVYQAGETFNVEKRGVNGRETLEVKTGTLKINGEEIENWVSAQKESQVADFLLMMYVQKLDYMKLCSKNLDKNIVDKALSEWESLGGAYHILTDKNGNVVFTGGKGASVLDILDTQGTGSIKFQTIQEKTKNYVAVVDNENEGKYVIIDIEFDKK